MDLLIKKILKFAKIANEFTIDDASITLEIEKEKIETALEQLLSEKQISLNGNTYYFINKKSTIPEKIPEGINFKILNQIIKLFKKTSALEREYSFKYWASFNSNNYNPRDILESFDNYIEDFSNHIENKIIETSTQIKINIDNIPEHFKGPNINILMDIEKAIENIYPHIKYSKKIIDTLISVIYINNLAKTNNSFVSINTDDILFLIQIKGRKRNNKINNYQNISRNDILESLNVLSSCKIKNKPILEYNNKIDSKYDLEIKINPFLNLSPCLYHKQLLNCSMAKKKNERKLYFHLQKLWNKKISYKPIKIKEIISIINMDAKSYKKFERKKQIEKYFNELVKNNLIESWTYINECENLFKYYKWHELWLDYEVIFEPAFEVIKFYHPASEFLLTQEQFIKRIQESYSRKLFKQKQLAESSKVPYHIIFNILHNDYCYGRHNLLKLKAFYEKNKYSWVINEK